MIDAAAFAQSDALTLGIEEEFFLLDASVGATGIVPRADEILNGAFQTIAVPGGWLKSELLRGTVEVNTAPSASLDQLDVDLRAVRDELARRAVDVGLRAAALGSHPHHKVVRGDVSPTEAHESIADLFDRVGQLPDQSTHGIHVHVGMPDLEAAVGAMDAIAALVPLVIAVTANSPIDRGQVSPWQSVRAERLRVMQWAGPPPRVADAREYDQVRALHQLENTVDQRFLWEVAPVHALGTVELRSADANVDPGVALAVAALVQAVAARDLDGQTPPRPNESIERHNRWSATEFGARARFLVPGHATPVDAADILVDLVAQLRPWATRLGSAPWLDTLVQLVEEPPAHRALAAYREGGVPAVLAGATLPPPDAT